MTKSNKPKRIYKKPTTEQKARAKEIRKKRTPRAEMNPEQLNRIRKADQKYNKTEGGEASKAKAQKKYQATKKGKATSKKYQATEKAKAARAAWRQRLQAMLEDNTINSKTEVQRMRPNLIRDCLRREWKKSTYSTDSSGNTIDMKENVVPPNASDEDILDEICRQILELEDITMGASDCEYFIRTSKLIKDAGVCESFHVVPYRSILFHNI